MSILNLFRKPVTTSPETIQDCVRQVGDFATCTIATNAGSHPNLDGMRLDLLTLFAFGGVHVLAMQRKLSQPEGQAVAITSYHQHLGWSLHEAGVKALGAISAAGPDGYPHLKAVIHKGIDGFLAWQAAPGTYSGKEFTAVLDAFDQTTT